MSSKERDLFGPESAYALGAELEIVSILRTVQRNQQLLQLRVPGADSTVMLRIQHADSLGVTIDYPGEELLNGVQSAKQVTLEGMHEGVLLHFQLAQLKLITHDGHPALHAPLPSYVIRLQRRENFRVRIPISSPLACRPNMRGRILTLPVDDISAGGVGIIDEDYNLPKECGLVLRDCQLDLTRVGVVTVDLKVVQVHSMRLPNGKSIQRFGCAFDGRLSSRIEQAIQRYIFQIERESMGRRRGWD